MTVIETDIYKTDRVADLTGLTLRQLGYWEKIGVLVPSIAPGGRGSGSRRVYSRDDVRLAAILQAVAPRQESHGGRHHPDLARLRRLVVSAFRAHPAACYFIVLDNERVVAADTATDAVAATNEATFATVICPDKIIPR